MDKKSAFGGIARLYGEQALDVFEQSSVLVIGVGGVGTWVLEALARSGIARLGLVDLDDVCVSNINRQLHALRSTVGQAKIEAMGNRLLDINPALKLDYHHDFYTEQSSVQILQHQYDCIVDATDSLSAKVHLAVICREKKIPFVMIGGAAGKTDPQKVYSCDLADTIQDSLLFRVRKKLRLEHGFPAPMKKNKSSPARKKMKVTVISSTQRAIFPDGQGSVCATPPQGESLRLDCASGLGSVSMVTGTFGLLAASVVLQKILDSTLKSHED
jgi:tRNA threonylcarbamoyladenosine dehydratase